MENKQSRCDERDGLPLEEQAAHRKADQADASISQKVDDALWKDDMLRGSDYHEIDVAVRDSIVTLSGNVMSTGNYDRAESAASTADDVLGVTNNLVPDDQLVRDVAGALIEIEHTYGVKFSTGARNGVVRLNGEVGSAEVRSLAEKCVASIPGVRGVHNYVRSPGVDLTTMDERFLQPQVGMQIFFRSYLSGTVYKVVINPDTARVVAMIVQGRYSNSQKDPRMMSYEEVREPERFVEIPMKAIRTLTKSSGFLRIDNADEEVFRDFDPSRYVSPNESWVPPYPYCPQDVLIEAEAVRVDQALAELHLDHAAEEQSMEIK